jgi:TolB-like protein/DNA-binding winged helix-turn-helix (wHTH) protein/Flp pilus assembly protein TadD
MRDALGFDGVKPSPEITLPVRFAGLVLNLDACTLARDSGDPIPLTRGEFALLRMFVTRPGRVISRDTLLDAFNRRFEPFDRSIDVLVGRLRKKIEADPKKPRLIVTVPGEGYRFDGLTQPLLSEQKPSISVPASQESSGGRDGSVSPLAELPPAFGEAGGAKAPMPDRPEPPRLSIVVLPFANIGGDPEQAHFVDGEPDDRPLAHKTRLVIARNTAFAYKGKALDLKTIGRELNVRYALEGSVRRSGNRTRVNVQLIDTETAAHLWAERFDKPLVDLFDMQDEIVARLANQLRAELISAEARRAEQAPNPDSIDLCFQGLACLHRGLTLDHAVQARKFFDLALAADPENVDALIGSGSTHTLEGAMSLAADPFAAFAAAEAKLTTALSLAPNHAHGHMWLGLVDILTKRVAEGIARCEHALDLDPNLAHAHALIGYGKMFVGRLEETESHVATALRISPRDPRAFAWMSYAGMSKTVPGKYEQAVVWLQKSIEANRNFPHAHFFLASAFAHLDRMDEARSAVRAGLALNPAYCISRDRAVWTRVSDDPTYLAKLDLHLEGLRKAGAPE